MMEYDGYSMKEYNKVLAVAMGSAPHPSAGSLQAWAQFDQIGQTALRLVYSTFATLTDWHTGLATMYCMDKKSVLVA